MISTYGIYETHRMFYVKFDDADGTLKIGVILENKFTNMLLCYFAPPQ